MESLLPKTNLVYNRQMLRPIVLAHKSATLEIVRAISGKFLHTLESDLYNTDQLVGLARYKQCVIHACAAGHAAISRQLGKTFLSSGSRMRGLSHD